MKKSEERVRTASKISKGHVKPSAFLGLEAGIITNKFKKKKRMLKYRFLVLNES